MISWDLPKLRRFKVAYARADGLYGKDSTFDFDGNKFVVSYAKYLIEYLEQKLGPVD